MNVKATSLRTVSWGFLLKKYTTTMLKKKTHLVGTWLPIAIELLHENVCSAARNTLPPPIFHDLILRKIAICFCDSIAN